jgi:DNA-binding CsgD family transcriptional regulator
MMTIALYRQFALPPRARRQRVWIVKGFASAGRAAFRLPAHSFRYVELPSAAINADAKKMQLHFYARMNWTGHSLGRIASLPTADSIHEIVRQLRHRGVFQDRAAALQPTTVSSLPSQLVTILGAVIANCRVTVDDIDIERRTSKRNAGSAVLQLEQRLPIDNPTEIIQISELITLRRFKSDGPADGGAAKPLAETSIAILLPGNRRITRLTFFRREDFSEHELRFLELLSPHIAQAMASAVALSAVEKKAASRRVITPADLRQVRLTRRETEVLRWVAEGKRNREIALILDTSSRTIQKHVQRILDKLCVETRGAAAAWWFEGGRQSPAHAII